MRASRIIGTMIPARWVRMSEIAAAAREKPERERGAFLDSACQGDAILRAEVEQLLAAGNGGGSSGESAGDPDATLYLAKASGAWEGAGDEDSAAAVDAVAPEPGALLGPYCIEQRIGSGGMGAVYRARDTRLSRSVAIKIIHPRLSSPQLEAALLREAQLASSLNHAGIVTIYDILRNGGMTCIVMEFVSGKPLLELIPENGFAVERALSLALAIGEAVAAAHSKGIVHRDLKPANILVREDGQVKILDFGLAKLFQSPDAETKPKSIFGDTTVGTIGYMAPEQARAEEVDERADIFSFGVILWQMLTGAMPFQAANAVALLHAIMTQQPPSLRAIKPEIPAGIENAVLHALAKDPAQRYRNLRDMLAELRAASSITAAVLVAPESPAPPTLAVLPLVNMSPDAENDYICDGLAEELINGLTQIQGLSVVSRSSSFQFKGASPDVRQIGRRLGAGLLVQGSLRRSGDQLRLTVQLSKTSDGYQIWSQRFDAQMRNLFALQDELTAAVLVSLRQQLGAKFPELAAGKQMPKADAYDLYLQARFAFNQETPAEFRRALELFLQSSVADPAFVPAMVGVAETHMRLAWYGLESPAKAAPAAKSALSAALEREPESVSALCSLASTQAGWDWDWAAAGRSFERALAAGDGLATVHFHYGLDFLTPQGRLEEALDEMRKALRLDPLSPIVNTAVGGCLYRMRRWDESVETLLRTLRSNPGFGHAHWSLGRAFLEQGRYDEALKQFEDAAKIMGQIPPALAELGYCYARMGKRELAHCTVQELNRLSAQGWVSPLNEALVYTGLGEQEAAIKRLQAAVQMRIRQLVWVNVDPRYDSLRQSEAYQRVIGQLGLAAQRA